LLSHWLPVQLGLLLFHAMSKLHSNYESLFLINRLSVYFSGCPYYTAEHWTYTNFAVFRRSCNSLFHLYYYKTFKVKITALALTNQQTNIFLTITWLNV
jgi:hypothetical protein